MGEFWSIPKEIAKRDDLSWIDKAVYAVLFTRRNGENIAWPSQKHISESIGVSERAVRSSIKNLSSASLITNKRLGKTCTNRYTLVESDRNSLPLTQAQFASHDRNSLPVKEREQYKITNKRTTGRVLQTRNLVVDNPTPPPIKRIIERRRSLMSGGR